AVVAVGEAEDVGEAPVGNGGVGGHRRQYEQAAVRVNVLARQHHATVHVADDGENLLVVADRLSDGLALFGVRPVVHDLRGDLAAQHAPRGVPLVDGEIDRLTHFDAKGC